MSKLRAIVKNTCFSALKNESGQGALIAVLVLLVIGSIMLPPLMGLIGTGLRAGQLHEEKMQSYYAADAGVEDALWQIKYDEVEDLVSGYNQYEFGVPYPYPDPLSINNNSVDVSIENIWIPEDYISTPSASEAQEIVDDQTLVVTGRATSSTEYQIKIVYNYQELEDYEDIYQDLEIDSIGIWLPQGFNYIQGSSNLEDDGELDPPYLCEPSVQPYKSGEAVVWDFSNGALFTNFPGVAPLGYPLVSSITFEFSSTSGQNPDSALSWVITDDVDDLSYSWDADTRVFNIESISSQTTVTAHTAKTEMRKMTSATEGDYFATGSSLLEATGDQRYRNKLYENSSATIETDEDGIDGIPSQGMVEVAYLYWTGWIDWEGYDPSGSDIQLFYDDCTDLYSPASNWEYGSDWHESGSYSAFYAHHDGGDIGNRIISTKDGLIDLSDTTGKTVEVSWRSWNYNSYSQESDDCLYYSYSGNGGGSWSSWQYAFCDDIGTSPISYSYEIPDTVAYRTNDVKIRFGISTYDGYNEYVYIDNVSVTTEGSAGGSLEYPDDPTPEALTTLVEETARVNRVYFSSTESDTELITADHWQTLEPDDVAGYGLDGTWYYCCVSDVTAIIRQWIENEQVSGNAASTYTLSQVIADNEVDPSYSFNVHDPDSKAVVDTTGYPLGTPACSSGYNCPAKDNLCHCGWSLLVVYSSPDTEGHQLYLFDIQNPDFDFFSAWHNNPDFDGDGEDGGLIKGFLVPEPVEGEEVAARLTVFVGEGDDASLSWDFAHDYIIVKGTQLENSESPPNDVWNSASPGLTVPGVDIDTFVIRWDDYILEPGDTSVQVDIPTGGTAPPYGYSGGYEYNLSDGYTMVYMILSFRSEVTTGGTLSYLIGGG